MNNYPNGNYQNNVYNDGFSDGFDTMEPIVTELNQLKTLFAEEVIAKSFLFMFAALLISAIACVTTTVETMVMLVRSGAFYGLLIAEIVIVFVSSWALSKNMAVVAGLLYAAYSYITGMTVSIILYAYTDTSVLTVFLITASVFGVMAVYGLLTKKDLTSVGSLCLMGLVGVIISGIVNIFIRNNMLDMITSCISVFLFVGLTAYDAQKIKERVEYSNDDNVNTLALYGGFQLYLDFVNLFLDLLRIFGKKK